MKAIILSTCLALSNSALLAKAALEIPVLEGTSVHTLTSSIHGEDFVIYLKLPPEALADPDAKFPLLLTLDADHMFPQVASIATQMGWSGDVPPVIVAGIGYGTLDLQGGNHRSRDYRPFADDDLTGIAGGPDFHTFLLTEALPFLEANAPVDPENRFLIGHSLSGLFTLYTYFKSPDSFAGYLAGSPYLKDQLEPLAGIAAMAPLPETRLFIATGSEEAADLFLDPMPALKSWLESYSEAKPMITQLAGFEHTNSITPAIALGLNFLFLTE